MGALAHPPFGRQETRAPELHPPYPESRTLQEGSSRQGEVAQALDERRLRRRGHVEGAKVCAGEILSTPIHKYDDVCGEGFLGQTRRERRAYPSGVCKARATTSGPKRTAARRVASLFGSGFVAPRSQPTSGDAPSSRLARTENRRNKRHRIYELEY